MEKGAGMTGMLPITELLDECRTDAERAQWLLNVPQFILYRDQMAIYRVLRAARFYRGAELVDLEISGLLSKRDMDGKIPEDLAVLIDLSRRFLKSLARKGGLV